MNPDRRLIVMRHAKSSWSSEAQTDHARPLNERGRRDAPAVATRIVELGWEPDWILSSDAERTQETALRMQPAWTKDIQTRFVRSLYHAGYEELASESMIVPDEIQTLMILGHNPGWEDVVHALTGESVVMKTATAALLSSQGKDWHEALHGRGRWTLNDLIHPRELATD